MKQMLYLECDRCGNSDDIYGQYPSALRIIADQEGWQRINDEDVCLKCLEDQNVVTDSTDVD
jgi:hypothetical protein